MSETESFPVVSSNTLFHFTNNLEHLVSILRDDFRPRYCMELFEDSLGDGIRDLGIWGEVDFAIPMVCFCDIPLSLTAKHLKTYGYYGIGLSKAWGMKNGLNPLLYCHADSAVFGALAQNPWVIEYLESQEDLSDNTKDTLDRIIWNLGYLTCFIKPYEGSFLRKDEIHQNIRFYDEREWRFVPPFTADMSHPSAVPRSHAADTAKMQKYNRLLAENEAVALKFTPNDIRYIIVKEEDELLEIESMIDELKVKYSEPDRRLLKTRLISARHIREDF